MGALGLDSPKVLWAACAFTAAVAIMSVARLSSPGDVQLTDVRASELAFRTLATSREPIELITEAARSRTLSLQGFRLERGALGMAELPGYVILRRKDQLHIKSLTVGADVLLTARLHDSTLTITMAGGTGPCCRLVVGVGGTVAVGRSPRDPAPTFASPPNGLLAAECDSACAIVVQLEDPAVSGLIEDKVISDLNLGRLTPRGPGGEAQEPPASSIQSGTITTSATDLFGAPFTAREVQLRAGQRVYVDPKASGRLSLDIKDGALVAQAHLEDVGRLTTQARVASREWNALPNLAQIYAGEPWHKSLLALAAAAAPVLVAGVRQMRSLRRRRNNEGAKDATA
jgi:hypothetical protein